MKWCGRHGEPIKGLLPDERVITTLELELLQRALDPKKAEEIAEAHAYMHPSER